MRFKLILGAACALVIAMVAWAPFGAAATGRPAAHTAKKSKGLTKAQVIALIKQYAGSGPQGPPGPTGTQGPPGPSTGAAGGALAGTYPDPTLNVSGGDDSAGACKTGEFVFALSSSAALGCGPTGSSAALGSGALQNATAPNDAAVGLNALNADTFGKNSALGSGALSSNTTGGDNSAVGMSALTSDTTGALNSAFGVNALKSNTTGGNNTALGLNALEFNTAANINTAVGEQALENNTTGTGNVALGFNAGHNLTIGDNNIDIDNNGLAGDADTIKIGTQGTQTSTSIAGIDGETSTSGVAVLVNSNGTLGTTTSSRRYKRDIRPLGGLTNRLMALRPVSFHYRNRYAHGGSNPLQFGLVAEQVAKVLPNLVARDQNARPYEVRYQELPVLLLATVQRQQHEIRTLRTRNERIDHLQAQVDWLMHHP